MVLVEGEEEGAESERERERRRRISHVIIMDWQAKRWRKEEEEVVVARRRGGAGKCLLWDVCVVRWGEGVLCCGLGLFLWAVQSRQTPPGACRHHSPTCTDFAYLLVGERGWRGHLSSGDSRREWDPREEAAQRQWGEVAAAGNSSKNFIGKVSEQHNTLPVHHNGNYWGSSAARTLFTCSDLLCLLPKLLQICIVFLLWKDIIYIYSSRLSDQLSDGTCP